MRWADMLRGVITGTRTSTFAEPAPVRFSDPGPVSTIVDSLLQGMGRVGREQALSVPVVLRGRNLICGMSTLPLQAVDANNELVDHPLLRQIDPNVPNVTTV